MSTLVFDGKKTGKNLGSDLSEIYSLLTLQKKCLCTWSVLFIPNLSQGVMIGLERLTKTKCALFFGEGGVFRW